MRIESKKDVIKVYFRKGKNPIVLVKEIDEKVKNQHHAVDFRTSEDGAELILGKDEKALSFQYHLAYKLSKRKDEWAKQVALDTLRSIERVLFLRWIREFVSQNKSRKKKFIEMVKELDLLEEL